MPVPYDGTVEFRSGAREGPRAIIDASNYLELYDAELDCEPSEVGIFTLPEVQVHTGNPRLMAKRVSRIAAGLLEKRKVVVMLGGEHSLTVGMVRAYSEKYPDLSVLQLDAHSDLRNDYMGTRYGDACVMRRVIELCPAVQVGIRSLSLEEHQFLDERNMKLFYAESVADPDCAKRVTERLSEHVYVTVDLDVFDPSIMSAVGTPEPGGLSWQQVLGLLRAVASGRRIVGFDVVELCPAEGPTSCAFLAAKLAYKLIGYATLLPPGPNPDS